MPENSIINSRHERGTSFITNKTMKISIVYSTEKTKTFTMKLYKENYATTLTPKNVDLTTNPTVLTNERKILSDELPTNRDVRLKLT